MRLKSARELNVEKLAPWGILILVILAALAGWVEQSEAKAEAEAKVEELKADILNMNEALNTVLREKRRAEQLELAARDERDREKAKAETFKSEMRRLSRENKKLDAYLRSGIHPDVVSRMWVQPGGGDGVQVCVATGDADGADACASVAVKEVSHEEGWSWCKDVEAALGSCNVDKAKLREWAAGVRGE